MNRLLQISTPTPPPFNILLSTFLTNRYQLPRLTKSIIVKNTINVTHEELRGFIQAIPLYRIFSSRFKNIIGTFDYIDQRSDYKAIEDVMVVCNISHNIQLDSNAQGEFKSGTRVITLKDFDYYYISEGKIHKHIPDSPLEETFFHILDPVITNKQSPVELSFVAYSNWTELSDQFINDNYLGLFNDTEKQIALTEYQHIKAHFKDITCPAVFSWTTGIRPNNILHIRFDFLDCLKEYYVNILEWILDDFYEYIKTCVKTLPQVLPEGEISLIKDSLFSNYILYAILCNQGVDCINNTINHIPTVTLDMNSFFESFEDCIKNLRANIKKELLNI